MSCVQGRRLPCGGWLDAGPVDKIILRACMSSGTPLRVSPALPLFSSAGMAPAGVGSSVLLVSCVSRSKVKGWWMCPRL